MVSELNVDSNSKRRGSIPSTVEDVLEAVRALDTPGAQVRHVCMPMLHFVFENETDADILKLGEIVNSEQQHAKKVRDGLQALYKAYQGTVKNKDTWSGLIQSTKEKDIKKAAP